MINMKHLLVNAIAATFTAAAVLSSVALPPLPPTLPVIPQEPGIETEEEDEGNYSPQDDFPEFEKKD